MQCHECGANLLDSVHEKSCPMKALIAVLEQHGLRDFLAGADHGVESAVRFANRLTHRVRLDSSNPAHREGVKLAIQAAAGRMGGRIEVFNGTIVLTKPLRPDEKPKTIGELLAPT
ncbi:MAG: hypothetical protein COT81_00890 [Candidatus Buchananbacteria bacterium CG10_big_fil_rev_8_21_14_0_10_42_9]|uniref:Uncharacterized protein n=1 Tax=Candidatus Buchananbacteria bacterium CG10_big_fil_rev_8_21_14_0_10_42_9 TaxID=1974526 RepID=A0A2H0W2A0_9BACT|nr:MAG: hypothetical protein COT81_00890 [Candidatus Buchananbacteria bacterium CG10_big_fil_rev_8_21_14_0_10_42_9]